jgi:predicted fused transcriptional regulator/phosphomethylpyrimidine kinase
VEIERFVWTEHVRMLLDERGLDVADVEQAIRSGHAGREVNDGRAEWLVSGVLPDGVPFEAIYDHPHDGDEAAVRIVSAWRLDS